MGKEMSKVTEEEAFRDAISTVDKSGKRNWIFPKRQKGRFYKYRTYVSFVLLALMFGMPFIKVNGQPLMLFNILERKFIIFGLTFWPQDFHLFVLAMLTSIVCIVLFTVVYGRLFCGWACPQTIFMEMVFRKIEYWIDGDAAQQKRLAKAPWNADKIQKRLLKHSIFFAIAFLIGNTFLAYIIGVDELFKIITDPPMEHIGGLLAMMIFSLVFYFVFAYMREQVCLVVCPYGRLQGVMLDRDSIVVHYDFERGEPRGKIKRKPKKQPAPKPTTAKHKAFDITSNGIELQVSTLEEKQGDCIDCGLCVRVCPTGIDIRNGTQLECINCTACIDACDEIMEKVNRPKGLIRYASYNNIANKTKFEFTPRIIAYTAVLVVLTTVLTFFLATRSDFETTLLRTPGMLYQEVDENTLSNLYNVEMVNKTIEELPVSFKVVSPPMGKVKLVGTDKNQLTVPKQGLEKGVMFIELPRDQVKGAKNKVVIEVYSGDRLIDRVKTNFIGPIF